jgi:hypothetical protein
LGRTSLDGPPVDDIPWCCGVRGRCRSTLAREGAGQSPARASSRLSLAVTSAGRARNADPLRIRLSARSTTIASSTLSLLVLQTDNAPRVRDGYNSLCTRGHTQARQTQREAAICRRNVVASARPCPPVPPRNLHGKEGVDGSSPSEGFDVLPAQPPFPLPRLAVRGVSDVHAASTAWTSAGLSPPNMSSSRIAC